MKAQERLNSSVFCFLLFVFCSYANTGLSQSPDIQKKHLKLPTLNQLRSFNTTDIKNYSAKEYYLPNLGIMCKLELEMTKAKKVPVYMRLGTKEYVDKLEKKY